MNASETYQTFLLNELAARKRRNPNYSLRSFAKAIEVSPAHLSLVLNGKKRLTPKLAVSIAQKLSLSSEETIQFLASSIPELRAAEQSSGDEKLLSEDEFRLVSDWYHFALLSLSNTKHNRTNARLIGRRFGIDPVLVTEAFARLRRLGLIEEKNGRFTQTAKPLTTSNDIPSAAIRSYHLQNLNLAKDKLESVPVELREFSTITMALEKKKLPRAKKMIRDFKRRLCSEVETASADEVYTLAVQLFPLTITEPS